MLKLKHGGILERTGFKIETQDVTDIAISYLHEDIEFDDNVTLRDLFLVINKELELFNLIFGNWIDEYTNVILCGVPESEEENNQIDHLLVSLEIENEGEEYNIPSFPEFHGVGICKEPFETYKEGDEIKWGISFSPMQKFADTLLVLDPFVHVYNSKTKEKNTYPSSGYTFFNVIYAIVYEISFHGGPEDTEKVFDSLNDQIKKIKSGEIQTFPIEDLFENIQD
jgi:hypothetical protein